MTKCDKHDKKNDAALVLESIADGRRIFYVALFLIGLSLAVASFLSSLMTQPAEAPKIAYDILTPVALAMVLISICGFSYWNVKADEAGLI